MKSYNFHFYALICSVLSIFMTFSGCASNKISPKKYYNLGSLRITQSDNNVKMFSFFIRDEFMEADNSKKSKKHRKLTENQEALLNEHLKRRGYCKDKEGELNFAITGKQNPVYQEVEGRDRGVKLVNIMPMSFSGKCVQVTLTKKQQSNSLSQRLSEHLKSQ